MEIIQHNSKFPSNPFEHAVVNTFAKVKVGDCVRGITIGPNKTITERDVWNGMMNSDVELSLQKENCNVEKQINVKCPTEEENSFYAMKALVEMESLRRMDVLDSINQQAQRMANMEEELQCRRDENLKLMKEEMHINNKLKRRIIESNINEEDLIISRKFSELLQKSLDTKFKNENEIINGQNAKAENLNEELKLKTDRLRKIKKIQMEYYTLHDKIMESVNRCKNNSELWIVAPSALKKFEEFNIEFNNITDKLKKTGNVETSDIEACSMILELFTSLTDKLNSKINQINEKEINREETKQKLLEKNEAIFAEASETDSATKERVEDEIQTHNISDRYICQESLDMYTRLQDNLVEITSQIDPFIKDPDLKKFILKLKIAINTPVNALLSSADCMRDKFNKIAQLLRGNFTFLTNTPNLQKEQYFPFLIDFLSKKFIDQGEILVSSKPEDAFVLASVIVAIWTDFPDFGLILLAHFMKKCPYIIPAYWPHFEGQSDKHFYVSRGYNYQDDGSLEDQCSFLNRMNGIFMLYIATVSMPPKNQPHPYGIQNAWKWFAGILNLEPRPDITASLLYSFLKLAGFKLSYYYGIQFWKVMHLLNTEFFLKIEKVTNADFRGPLNRLKQYLEKILRDGCFVEPKGILPPNYW